MTNLQPIKITLPPLQIVLNDEQQVSLQWLASTLLNTEPPLPQLEDSWKKWLAVHKLMNHSEEALIQCMVDNGIDQNLAIHEVKTVMNQPYVQAGEQFVQMLQKLESILQIQHQLASLSSQNHIIPRVPFLSQQEFLDQYYSQNKPVILTNVMQNWKALQRWTPDYFKENYGHVTVEVQAHRDDDPNYEINVDQHRQTILFQDYIDKILQKSDSNDYYMVANNRTFDRPEMKELLNDIEIFPEYLNPDEKEGRVFFWFGGGGTVTPLHHDPVNIFLAQVSGRKLIKMISPQQTPFLYNEVGVFSKVNLENPDYHRYPLFRNVRSLDVILHPGEVIFLPVGWWHYVKSLDLSISVSFINFLFPNAYDWKNPSFGHY